MQMAGKGALLTLQMIEFLLHVIFRLSFLLVRKGYTMKPMSNLRSWLSVIAMLVLAFPTMARADSGGSNDGEAFNIEVVGHNDLGMRGFNADVWVHKGYAYVGQWGFGDWAAGAKDRFCPQGSNTSALIIDARDPTNPQVVGKLQNPPNTSIEDIVVYTARYGSFRGHEIAAGGIQYCGDSIYDAKADRGLMLWDVTNPAAPVQIGYLKTACCARGVHEFEVQHRTDLRRTFAYASVPTSRYLDSATPSGYRDENGDGDFRLFDITDPAHPFQVSDWGIQDIAATRIPTMGTARSHRMMANWYLSPIGTVASLPST
jgi:hypothetical protein